MTADKTYAELLAETLPAVIKTDQDHSRLVAVAEDFMRREMDGRLSDDEGRAFELVTLLIQDYESRVHPAPEKKPYELLKFLMAENGLSQADLLPIFNSHGYISDVLSGRRNISIEKAKHLAERFKVHPSTFIDLHHGVRVTRK